MYVIKRPGVDEFMRRVGELYEVVVFTASVSKVSAALVLYLPFIPTMITHNQVVRTTPPRSARYSSGRETPFVS